MRLFETKCTIEKIDSCSRCYHSYKSFWIGFDQPQLVCGATENINKYKIEERIVDPNKISNICILKEINDNNKYNGENNDN